MTIPRVPAIPPQDTAAAEGVLTITEDRQAQGLLELSNDQRSLWFEVLHRWPQALRAYENIQVICRLILLFGSGVGGGKGE